MISIDQITQILPHRYPFLLVDRVLEINPGKSVKGLKNVTYNEPFFQGHFPGQPIMPGVLILEAMSQVGGFIFLPNELLEKQSITRGYVIGFERVKFKYFVTPGDSLIIEAKLSGQLQSLAKIKAMAYVGDNLAAEAEISYRFE
jgi:3-hydroxyacyl-[acyl-carrier-protein] dehydratase